MHSQILSSNPLDQGVTQKTKHRGFFALKRVWLTISLSLFLVGLFLNIRAMSAGPHADPAVPFQGVTFDKVGIILSLGFLTLTKFFVLCFKHAKENKIRESKKI
jgi:hypothetical protein